MSSSSIYVFHDHHGCRVVAVATWVDHRPGSGPSRDMNVTKIILPVKDKNRLLTDLNRVLGLQRLPLEPASML